MNYLEAIKKPSQVVKSVAPVQETVYVQTDEEDNYSKNVQDSGVAYFLPELQLMCEKFVNDSLYLDEPLLMKHHTGYRNFVIEMMNMFEENAYIEVVEAVEEDSEAEEDFDPTDLYNEKNHDKF